MIQKDFADKVTIIVKKDSNVIGLAAAGSWITNELDEYSGLDLILITENKITDDKEKMMLYVKKLWRFISGFTGKQHMGHTKLIKPSLSHTIFRNNKPFLGHAEQDTIFVNQRLYFFYR